MKKIMVIFGTRPEAIKMAPIIHYFYKYRDHFETIVCVTAQHRQMLDQVLELFDIRPKYDLDIMTENQTLPEITSKILLGICSILSDEHPDLILVQGDTTTTFASSLAAFYHKINVAHIEAGLRTSDKLNPYPEEVNRRLTSVLTEWHFTPTKKDKLNLMNEGYPENKIFVTGNTVVDAFLHVLNIVKKSSNNKYWGQYFLKNYNINLLNGNKTILVTGHRRESFGSGFENICQALKKIALSNPDVKIVYPVHLNPNVQIPVKKLLNEIANIYLIPPQDYLPFVYLMDKSYFILTDSGGIQEEAPSIEKPVLVMRNTTERTESIDAGITKLVGTTTNKIVEETENVLNNSLLYKKMTKSKNPYGDGTASQKIFNILCRNIFVNDKDKESRI